MSIPVIYVFKEMAKNFNGDFINLGKGGELGMVNPLEIIIDEDEEDIRNGTSGEVYS